MNALENSKKIVVRIATKNDIPDFYRLWDICFSDSNSFCDWLFSDRFYPEYAVLLEENGLVVSTMQAVPYTVMVRGTPVKSVMLCGVCTHPDHRKQGHMQKIFTFAMQNLYKNKFVIAVHTPAVLESYFPFGHLPVADALYLNSTGNPDIILRDTTNCRCKILSHSAENIACLHALYESAMTHRYSGIIARTKDEFARKWRDYQADGGLCFAVFHDDDLIAYTFFYEINHREKKLLAVECVAKENHDHDLIALLLAHAKERTCALKLPPDLQLENLPQHVSLERKQKGVAGCVNIALLLQSIKLDCDIAVEIVDSVIPENNGVFDMNGNRTDHSPACKVNCGNFLPILMGYQSLEREHCIEIYHENNFITLQNILTKCMCYIIDEY